jgi:uncharacterized membrane protein YjjP (DUF1212 family)
MPILFNTPTQSGVESMSIVDQIKDINRSLDVTVSRADNDEIVIMVTARNSETGNITIIEARRGRDLTHGKLTYELDMDQETDS